MQITRGTSERNHLFPKLQKPNIIIVLYNSRSTDHFTNGVKVITIPDMRWKRCDIKTTSLLANVLGKQTAQDKGVYESLQINNNNDITEGTTSNVFFVVEDNLIQTYPSNNNISNEKLYFLKTVSIVIKSGMKIVGVDTPEKM